MKKQNGITLIVLVITIVVLIILAGVAINLSLSEDGIFGKAKEAREQYKKSEVQEKIELAIQDIQTDYITQNKQSTIDTLLAELPTKLPDLTIIKESENLRGNYEDCIFTITSEFKVIIDKYNPKKYSVILNEENITSSGANIANEGITYISKLTSISEYYITNVAVTMNGKLLTKNTDYTYTNGILSIPNVNGNIEINVVTIVKPSGEYVRYEIDLNDDGDITNDWMIFYREEDTTNSNCGATYIIPNYYVSYEKMMNSVTNAEMSFKLGRKYATWWSSKPTNFVKGDNYDTVKQVFMYDYDEETATNLYAVSRLLYTDNWKDEFVTRKLQEKGALAIGGPTINMWCASWNKAYPIETIMPSITSGDTGYRVNNKDRLDISSYTGYKADSPNVYFPTKETTIDASTSYWIASPCVGSDVRLMRIYNDGRILLSDYYFGDVGIRPVVYLPKDVALTKDSTTANLWNINY